MIKIIYTVMITFLLIISIRHVGLKKIDMAIMDILLAILICLVRIIFLLEGFL